MVRSRRSWTCCLAGSFFDGVDNRRGTDASDTGRVTDPTAIESHVDHPLFHRRKSALVPVLEEKNVPRTVRVVTPIALFAMALLAIPHDIDTLTVWTANLDIGHRVPLCGK